MASEAAPLSSVLDDLERSGRDDAVSIGEVLDAFQHRSFGVLLTLFGLIAALPVIGDIPGMSILTGSLILLVIGQSLVGGGTLWMPDFVRRREISRDKFDRSLQKSRPWIGWVDRLLKPRLTALAAGRTKRWIIAAAAALLAVTFYPLAFVPFGVTAPSLGVLALGLGLMACDGLLVLVGYVLAAVTAYILFTSL
jgi:hypothetical protein